MEEILKLIGPLPDKTDLAPQIVEEVDCGSFTRQKVTYAVENNERVSAYICVPKNMSGKTPAIFCHHQHHGQFELGKSEVVGLLGDPNQAYAKELAERGYITFAPDAIAFEERQAGGEYFELASRLVQGKTLIAKVLHDAVAGLDYLQTRAEVDTERIGFIGHSYGGRMALWLPAFDNRIRASVSNCGCIDYRHSLTHDTGIQMEFCIPGFMEHFDLEDIIAQFKDCPLLISAGTDDKWSRGYDRLFEAIKNKGNDNVELKTYQTGHDFNIDMRQYAYNFLDEKLKF
jgi:dienelactone hydrolase